MAESFEKSIKNPDKRLAARARQELLAIQADLRKRFDDPDRWTYQEAAAVLVHFDPGQIKRADGGAGQWSDFLLDCEPIRGRTAGSDWSLKPEIRRAALRRLGSRPRMLTARAANVGPTNDVVQQVFDRVIAGSAMDLDAFTRDELGALVTVLEWLDGIVPDAPNLEEVRRRLPIADLLGPMRLLAGRSFVGREVELQKLRDYVGIIPAPTRTRAAWRFLQETVYSFTRRPPLMIAGPGGVGKSTLLARFILQHIDHADGNALPFVYLDIDRTVLRPVQPATFLAEAARQLAVQWPVHKSALEAVADRAADMVARYDVDDPTNTTSDVLDLVVDFRNALLPLNDRPTLLVIDTFEEAQYLGAEVVRSLWSVLSILQEQAPMLRTVIAGRSSLKGEVEPLEELVLADLRTADAVKLLQLELSAAHEPLPDSALEEITSVVGTNPMSLRLAATIVKEQGLEKLREVDTRSWLILRVKTETVQSRLYGRMLAHLHGDALQPLVYPGLVLRRITADLIRRVLAAPCGLDLDAPYAAEHLVAALSLEKAFIDRDTDDGALVYRQDVRRSMLRDLTNYVSPTTIAAIHSNAIEFYQGLAGLRSRGEELYHRLMRGDAADTLDARWLAGVENHLRTALEELPAPAQLWLALRLGVTPRAELRRQADLQEWEQVASTAVQRLLETGDTGSAFAVLAERSDRSPGSKLWQLESEAHRLAGDVSKSIRTADRGIKEASRAGETALVRMLLRRRAFVKESVGRIREALDDIEQALRLDGPSDQFTERLRLLTARVRLLRKLGPEHDAARRGAILDLSTLLTGQVLASLDRNPALLREIVAELGSISNDILTKALDVIGLDIRDERQASNLAKALVEWDWRSLDGSGGELAKRAGIKYSNSDSWLAFIRGLSSRRLANNVVNWRESMPPEGAVDKAIVEVYRDAVETTLARPKNRARADRLQFKQRGKLK